MSKTFEELMQIMEVYEEFCDDLATVIRRGDELHFYLNMNDAFYWASGDCEEIEVEDLPLLAKCGMDCRKLGGDSEYYTENLYACRKRGMRMQTPVMNRLPLPLRKLICSEFPVREHMGPVNLDE